MCVGKPLLVCPAVLRDRGVETLPFLRRSRHQSQCLLCVFLRMFTVSVLSGQVKIEGQDMTCQFKYRKRVCLCVCVFISEFLSVHFIMFLPHIFICFSSMYVVVANKNTIKSYINIKHTNNI